jgi:hypothetical protein
MLVYWLPVRFGQRVQARYSNHQSGEKEKPPSDLCLSRSLLQAAQLDKTSFVFR